MVQLLTIIVPTPCDDVHNPQLGAHALIILEAMMRQPLAWLFAMFLCGCAMTTASPVAAVFTPRELNTHPEQFDGREVVVRGGTTALALDERGTRQLLRALQRTH